MFHKARFGTQLLAPPALDGTKKMYESYPEEIRAWIDGQGGYKRMPMDDGWRLWARNLWEMGYRKCL